MIRRSRRAEHLMNESGIREDIALSRGGIQQLRKDFERTGLDIIIDLASFVLTFGPLVKAVLEKDPNDLRLVGLGLLLYVSQIAQTKHKDYKAKQQRRKLQSAIDEGRDKLYMIDVVRAEERSGQTLLTNISPVEDEGPAASHGPADEQSKADPERSTGNETITDRSWPESPMVQQPPESRKPSKNLEASG